MGLGKIDFRPLVQVSINGVPLSGLAFSALESVTVIDAAGFVSDTADLSFANASLLKGFAMPEPGAEVEIALGYLGDFKPMGRYIADEIEEASPPRTIHINCKAKAHGLTDQGKGPIAQQKSRSWPAGLTVQAIAGTIAGENGLELGVTDSAAGLVPGHIDQIDESDLSVLTRIAAKFDLIAKPAGGVLYIGKRAEGKTASGNQTPTTVLRQSEVSRWAMRRSWGEAVGTVIATYRDTETGKTEEVEIGEGEPTRRIKHRFSSEDDARTYASTEAKRASRQKETLEIEMPGNPSIVAEGKIVALDFSAASQGEWVITNATHSVSENGYSTSLSAERPT